MVDCIVYIALDLVDGYYQLLMQASNIPPKAASIPRDMLREWLVIPQQLSNAPEMLNSLFTQMFRPHRGYARTINADILPIVVPNMCQSDIENSTVHFRAVPKCMCTNKLYVNA